jgi:hypothetical protein
MQGASGSLKKQRMTSPCLPNTESPERSPLAPGSLTPSHPGSFLMPLSCNLLEPVRQDVEAHPALNRSALLLPVAVRVHAPAVVPAPAVLLALAVAVAVPPGFLLRGAVPVHVDDVYLAHVRLLRAAQARETPEQTRGRVKLQSSF